MYKSVLAAAVASIAILAGGAASATSIPMDDLAISGHDAVLQPELFANADELQNWKIVTPDLLSGNAGRGGVILQVNEPRALRANSNGPTPIHTNGPVQVPEPGTLLLLISALAATSLLLWRQRQNEPNTRPGI